MSAWTDEMDVMANVVILITIAIGVLILLSGCALHVAPLSDGPCTPPVVLRDCIHGTGDGSWVRCNAMDGTVWVFGPDGDVYHDNADRTIRLCERP